MRRGPGRDSGRGADSASSTLTSPSTRLKVVFVLLVGLSGGMMALQGGASVLDIGLTFVGGLVAGSGLLWYVLRIGA